MARLPHCFLIRLLLECMSCYVNVNYLTPVPCDWNLQQFVYLFILYFVHYVCNFANITEYTKYLWYYVVTASWSGFVMLAWRIMSCCRQVMWCRQYLVITMSWRALLGRSATSVKTAMLSPGPRTAQSWCGIGVRSSRGFWETMEVRSLHALILWPPCPPFWQLLSIWTWLSECITCSTLCGWRAPAPVFTVWPFFQLRHPQSYLRNDWSDSRQILYAGRIIKCSAFDDRLVPNGRGQSHVTRFLILPQSYLWNRWSYTLQISYADWVIVHTWYITLKGMCAVSRDLLRFWETSDNVLLTVQERDSCSGTVIMVMTLSVACVIHSEPAQVPQIFPPVLFEVVVVAAAAAVQICGLLWNEREKAQRIVGISTSQFGD